MKLPTFLIIGAAKAGTTAVYHALRTHPGIFMSAHKEPRFFAFDGRPPVAYHGPGDDTRFRFVKEWSEYRRLFEGAREDQAVGEASPWYLYVDEAAPAIRRRLPDVQLIAVLRDPVERAFSNYLHASREGLEPLPTFTQAMEAEADRIHEGWSPRWHYARKGFYYRQLSRYLAVFPRDQMRILLYDDLRAAPAAFYRELFGFLGVDATHAVDTGERHNESRAPKSRTVDRILNRPNPLKSVANAVLPRTARKRLRGRLLRANAGPRETLDPTVRARFIELYREDILRLQELLERDLSAWLS